jgi:aminomethyltransferase
MTTSQLQEPIVSDSTLRTTALTELHDSLGAKLVDFAGWSMPVWYDGATDEHLAVRASAGLFDLGHMGELFVSGPEAGAALDWAVLVDASAMPVGRARYSMICNEAGGIIDDLIVYRLADDRWMVVANASNAGVVADELRTRCASFDAVVDDDTDDWALIALQGPQAADILQGLVDIDLSTIRYYRIDQAELLGQQAMVARTGYTGEDGFELFVPGDIAVDLWQALADAGGDRVRACGLASRDTLRLEAGMPLYGNELSLDTTPFDVGAGRLIKDDAPDHVGRQALVAAADGPHRHLVGLFVDGRRPARAGYAVTRGGAAIGTVTSGALSPTLERPIAIASVDSALEVGDSVEIDVRGKPVAATVTGLPFYTRP